MDEIAKRYTHQSVKAIPARDHRVDWAWVAGHECALGNTKQIAVPEALAWQVQMVNQLTEQHRELQSQLEGHVTELDMIDQNDPNARIYEQATLIQIRRVQLDLKTLESRLELHQGYVDELSKKLEEGVEKTTGRFLDG